MKKICIAGIGNMGAVHFDRYQKLIADGEKIVVSGIFDKRKEMYDAAMAKCPEWNTRYYDDFDQMLEIEKPDAVDIVLPDRLHCEFVVRALEAGVNVLCEKPMATTVEDTQKMLDTAKRTGKALMIAHCCRYMTTYDVLREVVRSGRLGKLRMACFSRMSALPSWSDENWLLKKDFSGGCLIDMHVHDIDIVQWLFGKPKALSALAANLVEGSGYDSVTTMYRYDNAWVEIESVWDLRGDGAPFMAGYKAMFEKGTLLSVDGATTVYEVGKEPIVIPPDNDRDGYYCEIRQFIRILEGKADVGTATEEAAEVIRTAKLEIESAEQNGKWIEV